MTRKQWLEKQHKHLDDLVCQLEVEREVDRSAEHKALLVSTKKQRLVIKTELENLKASEHICVN